jgi:hypothetical protein
MRTTAIGIALAAALLAAGQRAEAGSQPVYGQRLIIKNALPNDESRNKISVVGRSGLITTPTPASDGDPTCGGAGGGGASLELTSETSGETVTLALPCENWQESRRGGGYEYLDRSLTASACRRIQIKAGKSIKATCQGKGPSVLDFDLELGVHQLPVDVTLRLGTGPEAYCMRFGGQSRRNGTDAKTLFASRAIAPTGACPP